MKFHIQQETIRRNKAYTSPSAPLLVEELSEVGCDRKSLTFPADKLRSKKNE